MEARRFGFDPSLPSACKFDPTDADIVAHYLLPRAAGVPNPPYAHAVIDDDPYSCPPWELLCRHGHEASDHAFFLGPPSDTAVNGGRACRRVGEPGGVVGVWRGQKGEDMDLVVTRGGERGGAELQFRFRRYYLGYYRSGDPESTGWVMHEYHILQPKLRPGAMLSRIRITGRAKKERKKQQQQQAAADAAMNVAPGPDQPGPSNYHVDDRASGNAAAVVASDGEGTSGGAQADVLHQCDKNGGSMGDAAGYYALLSARAHGTLLGETAGYYSAFLKAEEDGRSCVNNSNFSSNEGTNYGDGSGGD